MDPLTTTLNDTVYSVDSSMILPSLTGNAPSVGKELPGGSLPAASSTNVSSEQLVGGDCATDEETPSLLPQTDLHTPPILGATQLDSQPFLIAPQNTVNPTQHTLTTKPAGTDNTIPRPGPKPEPGAESNAPSPTSILPQSTLKVEEVLSPLTEQKPVDILKDPVKEAAPLPQPETKPTEPESDAKIGGLPTFDTPEDAAAAVPKFDVVPMGGSDQEIDLEAPSSRRVTKRGRHESGDSLPATRTRKEARRGSTRDDDTEPEQNTKVKRRKTLPSSQPLSRDSAEAMVEMGLYTIPDGWKQPLLYFVEGRPYDYSKQQWVHEMDEMSQSQSSQKSNDRRNVKWLRLGDTLIKTGAVYLTSTDSGTPNLVGHAEGPTAIIRDLCAIVQSGASDPVPLHLGAYTALSRANWREHISLKGVNWNLGMGVTRVLKTGGEKEAIQIVPMDLIAWCLANQLRALLQHTDLFPGHLFASPMHLLQFAPTIAIHLMIANRPRQLAELIRMFVDEETVQLLDEMEESYAKRTGGPRIAAGRRRMANKAKEHFGLRTYQMSASDRHQLGSILDRLEETLKQLKNIEYSDSSDYPQEFNGKTYAAGDVVTKDFEVPVLSMSAAAMRFNVYTHYGITPCLVDLWEDSIPETALQEVLKQLAKEDERWLMSTARRAFLDFTFTQAQEEWLMGRGWGEKERKNALPERPEYVRLAQFLLRQPPPETAVSSNCVLEVNLTDPAKESEYYLATVSMRTSKQVDSNEQLVLDLSQRCISWESLANAEVEAEYDSAS